MSYDAFINQELILFSMADNQRSIPALMDGLKPAQRKVCLHARVGMQYSPGGVRESFRTASLVNANLSQTPNTLQVLFSCFKRNLKKEIKVAQLAGYVSEHSAYHHGEVRAVPDPLSRLLPVPGVA